MINIQNLIIIFIDIIVLFQHAAAYKDLEESKCLLEILHGSDSLISKWISSGKKNSSNKYFQVHEELLSKREVRYCST